MFQKKGLGALKTAFTLVSLLGFTGLVHSAAANAYEPSVPTMPTVPTIAEVDLVMDRTVGLESGMLYPEARSRLINQGWWPHTFMTTGPLANWDNPTVQRIAALGFDEVKTCIAGRVCKFEFVYEDRTLQNGAVLVATAAVPREPSGDLALESNPSALVLLNWDVVDIANDTYAQQRFDSSILSRLLQAEGICGGLSYDCHYQTYAFADALLISAPYDFGETKVSLLLSDPVSPTEALSYARLIDTQSEIDFDQMEIDSESGDRVYSGCFLALNNGGDAFPPTCFARFSMTPNGLVSKVSVHHAFP